jgi:hypothetical protein
MRSFLFLLLFFISSCGQDLSTPRKFGTSTNNTSGLSCSCNNIYNAVCGSDGKTYSNSCLAQCNGVTWATGQCQSNNSNNTNTNTNCNSNSGPICGQPPFSCPQGMVCAQVMPAPVTYNNDCLRLNANAQFIQFGQCPTNTFTQ